MASLSLALEYELLEGIDWTSSFIFAQLPGSGRTQEMLARGLKAHHAFPVEARVQSA